MKIISASIDLNKIDRNKLIAGKNGAEYLNIDITIKDDKDAYGNDTAITLKQSKEERDSKAKKVYIGNGKTMWEGEPLHKPAKPVEKQPETIHETSVESFSDLPF